jgi:hypothetical protein
MNHPLRTLLYELLVEPFVQLWQKARMRLTVHPTKI